MKPFNLERALAGVPVVTGDGEVVQEIHHFRECTTRWSVVAVVDGIVRNYDVNGESAIFHPGHYLFMADKPPKKYYVNVYGDKCEIGLGAIYEDKEVATRHGQRNTGYIKTIEIEVD